MPKKPQPTETVCFRCPKDLADRLEDAKWGERKSKTDILIEALEKHLDSLGKKKGNKS